MSPTSRRIAGAVVSACALLALGSGVANATVPPGEPSAKPVPSSPPLAPTAPRPSEPSRAPVPGVEATQAPVPGAEPTAARTASPPVAAPTPPRSATEAPLQPTVAAPVPAPATPTPVATPEELAHTGGDNMTVVYTVAGSALLLLGAGGVFATTRMRGRSTD